MTKARSTVAMNKAIASLRTTSNHHTKDIQEIHETLRTYVIHLLGTYVTILCNLLII